MLSSFQLMKIDLKVLQICVQNCLILTTGWTIWISTLGANSLTLICCGRQKFSNGFLKKNLNKCFVYVNREHYRDDLFTKQMKEIKNYSELFDYWKPLKNVKKKNNCCIVCYNCVIFIIKTNK